MEHFVVIVLQIVKRGKNRLQFLISNPSHHILLDYIFFNCFVFMVTSIASSKNESNI